MMDILFGAGAVGALAGSRYGSGSNRMMRLLLKNLWKSIGIQEKYGI
jgi:hypothetical protein